MLTTDRPRLPRTVLALSLTSLFTDVGSEMIFPLLPIYLASLGGGAAYLGLIEGLADATSSLLKLGAGYAADRVSHRKWLVLFGYGIASFVRPLIAFASHPAHVLAVRVTDRIGKGIRSAPRDVLIADAVSSSETGRAFGFHRAMDHTGAVIGPLIATLFLSLGWSLRTVFALAVVPGILALLCVLMVREPPRPALPAHTSLETGPQDALPRSLRSYLLIVGLFSIGNASDAFLLLRARELGVSVGLLPTLWSFFHVVKVVTAYLAGGWSDRMPRTHLIVAGWCVYAATYLAFGLAHAPLHAWALFLVYGAYHGLTEPAEKALVKDLTPEPLRGRAYGYYNFVLGASALPASLLSGWLWQTLGPRFALGAGAAIAAVASLLLLAWKRRQ